MIPKIIHYCWFGGNPLPPLAQECIASWRKFLPKYEIWQWTEDPLNDNEDKQSLYDNDNRLVADKVMYFDPNSIPYTAEAYKQKKYAFVSDYARFWIMYQYGGLYFDTDVEVVKSMASILTIRPITHYGFMGFEQDPDGVNTPGRYAPRYCFAVNPGVGFGMTKGHPFIKRMMEEYDGLKFEVAPSDISWYKTIVAYTTELLCEEGLQNVKGIQTVVIDDSSELGEITVYPSEYFAPINAITGHLHITENTCSIHRYAGSWNEKKQKSLSEIVKHYLPEWVLVAVNRWKRRKYEVR